MRWRRALADRPGPTDRFGLLLAMLGVLFLLSSLRGGETWARALTGVLAALVAVQTLRVSAAPRRFVVAAVLTGVVAAVIAGIAAVSDDVPDWIPAAIVGALLAAAPFAVLGRILRHEVVSLQTILGAMCVYVLLALVFAFALGTIDAATGFEALTPPATDFRNDYLYVSVITLTTVGFGDVVATDQAGRTLLMIEAMTGQVFLVTLVARLVSLFGTTRTPARRPVAPASTPGSPD